MASFNDRAVLCQILYKFRTPTNMIVPDHWAEARKQQRVSGKQVTVRRFGWSSSSQADAQSMADARADDALQRIVAGEPLDRRERKLAYNGASGVPIREEVLARHGEEVITRNAYGAHCLNSPNALFADIDFTGERNTRPAVVAFAVLAMASAAFGFTQRSWGTTFVLLFVSLLVSAPLASLFARLAVTASGGAERIAYKRLVDFVAAHPVWNIRLYRTPAGYRVLATHAPFEPRAEEVQQFFSAVAADPVYVRMCTNQNCFRARLTAKPWRIGINTHMRPRPGIWPVQPALVGIRNEWIALYEARAAGFAACRYIESMGSGAVHASLQPVIDLHDRVSRAHETDTVLA
jgi:hypothetical protein